MSEGSVKFTAYSEDFLVKVSNVFPLTDQLHHHNMVEVIPAALLGLVLMVLKEPLN